MTQREQHPSLAQLQNPRAFTLLTTLKHTAMAPFMTEYYQRSRTPWVLAHYALSLVFVVAWIAVGQMSGQSAETFILTGIAAVIASVVLIPIHEAIHGVAYRLLGASNVRYALSLRKLYAYAIADRFVVDARELTFVALLPLAAITLILLILAIVLEPYRAFLIAVMFFHTNGSNGDWALVNFLRLNRARAIFSYDEAEKRESYFYARK